MVRIPNSIHSHRRISNLLTDPYKVVRISGATEVMKQIQSFITLTSRVWIEVLYTPLWYASIQKTIAFYLPNHMTLPDKVIIYSNGRKRILKLVEKLENYLDGDNKFEEIEY